MREVIITHISAPGDARISKKRENKKKKYQDLKREIRRMWNIRFAKVVPLIVEHLTKTRK